MQYKISEVVFTNFQLISFLNFFQTCVFPVLEKGTRLSTATWNISLVFDTHSLRPTWAFLVQLFCISLPQMRLPSKPYSTLPIYSLGPSAVVKEDTGTSAPAEPDKQPFGSAHTRHSLRRRWLNNRQHHRVVAATAFLCVHRYSLSCLCLGCPSTASAKTGGRRMS